MSETVSKPLSTKLYEDMTAKALACAEAQNAGKSKTDVDALKKSASDAMALYNEQIAKEVYQKMASDGDAVKTALTVRFIEGTKKISYKADKATGHVSAVVSPAQAKIDLPMMQKTIGVEHFADPSWFSMIQKLAFIIANALNKSLSDSATFVYQIDDAAKAFEFAPDADPTSAKSVVKALQKCADAILFVPKADKSGNTVNAIKMTSVHWTYIRECMTRQGKDVGEVAVGGTSKMSELVADAINLVILEKKPFASVEG